MIGSLRGRLVERGAGSILVEVGGVGYEVTVSPTTALALGDPGDEVFVWIHHHMREDSQALYGFSSRDERLCFAGLLAAHGVGPALALAILSVHGPAALARILLDDDVAALCLVPGVGRKTAARLLVELKDRLDLPVGAVAATPGVAAAGGAPADAGARADVREALDSLGYAADEIRTVLADLPDADDSSVLLREALRRLATVR